MGEPFIRTEQLSKSFGENHVIRSVDLEINRGEILTLIGKSGVGKSILLKLLINLIEPDAGRIFYEGRAIESMKASERKAFQRKMSYVFQGTALLDSMTVFENVALPLQERSGIPRAEIRQRVRKKLEQLDLADIDEKYPSQLSGGMKKRVALARALVTEPEIVLFDEPTTGLDPVTAATIGKLIRGIQKELGATSVVVTHDLRLARQVGDRVAFLTGGRFCFVGDWEEADASDDPELKAFLAGREEEDEDAA